MIAVNPALNQPTCSYPLQPVNLPAVFIAGEKVGQKVLPRTPGGPPAGNVPGAMPGGIPPGMQGNLPGGMPGGMPGSMGARQARTPTTSTKPWSRARPYARDPLTNHNLHIKGTHCFSHPDHRVCPCQCGWGTPAQQRHSLC